MAKLFIAIELSRFAEELQAWQPAAQPGVRLVTPDQMHVTLHYVGEAEAANISAALETVVHPLFTLTITGLGYFETAGDTVTLWARVTESPQLLALHAAIAEALKPLNFVAEARPYTPHVALARCGRSAAPRIEKFISERSAQLSETVEVDHFSLYESELVENVPRYTPLRQFPLNG